MAKSDNKIDHQAKQIVYNVYNYYKKRKLDDEHEELNLVHLVSEITGIKRGSVKSIITEGNNMNYDEDGFAMFRPKQKRIPIGKKKMVWKKKIVDEFTEAIIRRKVIQIPNITKLNVLLKEENILQCGRDFLKQLLSRLGFTTENYPGYPGILVENADIVSERTNYLLTVKEARDQDRPVFYLNNTKNWTSGSDNPIEMPNFVMLHMSGPGFLDSVQVAVKAKPDSEDDEVDECFEHFEIYDWMKDYILLNIPPNSMIIINIPQSETLETVKCEEKPGLDSPRSELEDWLKHYNIEFKENSSNYELMGQINAYQAKVEYNILTLIRESGHQLVHLPEKHPDLNPIAVMWYDVKEEAERTSPDELFTNYPKRLWDDCITHVRDNEEEFYAYALKISSPEYIANLKKYKVKEEPADAGSDNDDDDDDDEDNEDSVDSN